MLFRSPKPQTPNPKPQTPNPVFKFTAGITLNSQMSGVPRLRDVLVQFLKGTAVFYPAIEAKIVQLNPLQITDDGRNILEVISIQKEVEKVALEYPEGTNFKLILKEWEFTFRKVHDQHDFYFDIQSENFKLMVDKSRMDLEETEEQHKMIDDDEVRYNFEYRKREEIGDQIKYGVRGGRRNSPKKGGSDSRGPGTARETASPKPGSSPMKMFSPSGTSGERKSGSRVIISPDILPIEELLDIPIPIFTKEAMNRAYYGSSEVPVGYHRHTSGERHTSREYARYSRSQLYSRDTEEDTLGKRNVARLTFNEILRGLTKKFVRWDQFVFTQKTLSHLKERPYLLEER